MARLCNHRDVTLPSLNCAIFIFFVNIYSKIDGRRERTRNTELRPGVFRWVVGFRGPPAVKDGDGDDHSMRQKTPTASLVEKQCP